MPSTSCQWIRTSGGSYTGGSTTSAVDIDIDIAAISDGGVRELLLLLLSLLLLLLLTGAE